MAIRPFIGHSGSNHKKSLYCARMRLSEGARTIKLLPQRRDDDFWWIALADFVAVGDQDIIPSHCEGAVGWLAVLAPDAEDANRQILDSLAYEGLRVVSIDDCRMVSDWSEIEAVDDHLASNVLQLEPKKSVVWGTVHNYIAEGEA